MKGPQKLIEGDGQASAFGRELLREGRGEVMPAPAKAASWKSIAAQVPGALIAPGAAAAAGAAKGATGLVALKGTLAVVALGGALWGGHHVLIADGRRGSVQSRPAPPASSMMKTAQTAPAATSAAPAAATAIAPPAVVRRESPGAPPPVLAPGGSATLFHEPATPPRPRAATVSAQPGASDSTAPVSGHPRDSRLRESPLRESRLREESLLVLEAREGLRSGRASLVLRQLEAARTRFPDGTLAQEREALTIEALWRSGQTAAARQRAETFARTYPGSPHAARVQQLTSP